MWISVALNEQHTKKSDDKTFPDTKEYEKLLKILFFLHLIKSTRRNKLPNVAACDIAFHLNRFST